MNAFIADRMGLVKQVDPSIFAQGNPIVEEEYIRFHTQTTRATVDTPCPTTYFGLVAYEQTRSGVKG